MSVSEQSEDDSGNRARKSSGDSAAGKEKAAASGSDNEDDGKKAEADKAATAGSDEEDVGNVGAEDIFGDNLSISSDDDDDDKMSEVASDAGGSDASGGGRKKPKKAAKTLQSDDDSDRDVQRYDDDAGGGDEDKEGGSGGRSPADGAGAEAEKPGAQFPEEEVVQVPETRIDVEVPKITTDLGKELFFVKLPNFLSMECRPFDPESYQDEIEDEDAMDEEGRQRLKLKVENTIRWRQGFDAEGKAIKESNARIVRWSDGSTSLYLGSEVFDVHKQSLHGDFNHMFIRQGTGLQGQAIFRTKLSFRPHSTESKTHQKMTRQMADRSHKATGIKVISQVGRNPETNRYKRIKEEEERLRADLRRNSKMNRVREKATSRGLSKGYLEGEGGDGSDEEGFSINAIKNRYKKGGAAGAKQGFRSYSSEEDDSDVETRKAKRLEKAKANVGDSDSESEKEARRSRSRSRSGSRSGRSRSRSNPSSRSRSGSRSPAAGGSPGARRRSRSASRSRSRSASRSRSGSRSPSRSRSGSPAGSGGGGGSDSN